MTKAIIPDTENESDFSYEDLDDAGYPISNQTMIVEVKKKTTTLKELAGTEAEFFKI